jgi:hypothetical protein
LKFKEEEIFKNDTYAFVCLISIVGAIYVAIASPSTRDTGSVVAHKLIRLAGWIWTIEFV